MFIYCEVTIETRNLNFDVSRGGVQHRLFVRAGDINSRTFISRFYSCGEPIEVKDANIRILRPDKTEILGVCSVENNAVVYTFTGGEDTEDTVCDLAVAGEYLCEYILYGKDGAVMTSPQFIVTATDIAFDGEGAKSSNSYPALEAALMKLQEGNFSVTAVNGDEAKASVTVGETTIDITLTLPKGDKGDAPVRGTDYWTAADIAEIKSYVDDAILGGAW